MLPENLDYLRLYSIQSDIPELVVPESVDGDEDVPGEEDHQTSEVNIPVDEVFPM